MPQYTSHIYAPPNLELIEFLQSDSFLSLGLFHLHQLALDDKLSLAAGKFPKDGLLVIREVCDPTKPKDSHDEAQVHEENGHPVLSWWNLQGPKDVQIILPPPIPTLAFSQIHLNHETNLAPPVEFLRFLKRLSTRYEVQITFYHHYTAYEDRLADSEYAWIFGRQDFAYIRHVDKPYQTIRINGDGQTQVVHSKSTNNQPILHEVMKEYGVTLSNPSHSVYFRWIDWNHYRIT